MITSKKEIGFMFGVVVACFCFVVGILMLAHQRDEELWQWACNEDPTTYEELCGKLPETTTTTTIQVDVGESLVLCRKEVRGTELYIEGCEDI